MREGEEPRIRHTDLEEMHEPYQIHGQQDRDADRKTREFPAQRAATSRHRHHQGDDGQEPGAAIVDLVGEAAGLVDDGGLPRGLDADETERFEGGRRRQRGEPAEKRAEDRFPVGQEHQAGQTQQRRRETRTQETEQGSNLPRRSQDERARRDRAASSASAAIRTRNPTSERSGTRTGALAVAPWASAVIVTVRRVVLVRPVT